MDKRMRLDKYLGTYTEMSRKDAKNAIRRGRVTIDGIQVKKEDEKILISAAVTLDGVVIQAEQFVYYMLNKPSGVVSATKDNVDKTVTQLITDCTRDIFPIGRLDKDTEGLLLLTDDGELTHQLLSPRYHVDKRYFLTYDGRLNPDSIKIVTEGMDIGEKKLTKPATLELCEEGQAYLTISEGKFHQVKRMIAKLGGQVTYLKRVSMGEIMLDKSLQPGEYRRLTESEIKILKNSGKREE